MNETFTDFYRCPAQFAGFATSADPRTKPGYFCFGKDVICFGQCSAGYSCSSPKRELYDAFSSVRFNHSSFGLPYDLGQVIDNLRLERYVPPLNGLFRHRLIRDSYYLARPLLRVSLRKHLQKVFLRGWNQIPFPRWPVDTTVEQIFERLIVLVLESQEAEAIPFIWFWPEGYSSAVMMTHDVETEVGVEFCPKLMDMDESSDIRASFQIVPEERYPVTERLLDSIRQRGFEVNIQDLNHDGKLFSDRALFLQRVESINLYAKTYGARGFRAAIMYRNPAWYDALDFSYDLSIPNVAHLEAQRGGCCTVFPYFIGKILELPLTTVQDYSLFQILNDYSIDLWKLQIRLIQQKHGLVSFIVHPDYIAAKRAQKAYASLLEHLGQMRKEDNLWMALPGEIDQWWRARSRMRLVYEDGGWTIAGEGRERARLAFAKLENGRLSYTVTNTNSCQALHRAS